MFHPSWKPIPGERGYSWLYVPITKTWLLALLGTLITAAIAGGIYLWYSQFGNDIAPDSILGLLFASAGTLCFLLSATLYIRHRRSQRRKAGQLNGTLHWHIFLAILSLILLLMHSFGNFNARSGTYALYGMIALVVSGVIGRLMDRIMPRLLAAEVAKRLTLQQVCELNTRLQQVMAKELERSVQNEDFYRSVIHYWRIFHIALALITVCLVAWHLVFVLQLLVFHIG